jgi:hypothetical protein
MGNVDVKLRVRAFFDEIPLPFVVSAGFFLSLAVYYLGRSLGPQRIPNLAALLANGSAALCFEASSSFLPFQCVSVGHRAGFLVEAAFTLSGSPQRLSNSVSVFNGHDAIFQRGGLRFSRILLLRAGTFLHLLVAFFARASKQTTTISFLDLLLIALFGLASLAFARRECCLAVRDRDACLDRFQVHSGKTVPTPLRLEIHDIRGNHFVFIQ